MGATTQVAHHGPTNKVLWCSFFLLGMGLMAPWSAVMQTMDYQNEVYGEFNPSRILTVCYVALDLIALFTLFFFGHRVWPNKKSRLLAGYIIYTTIMVLLPIIDIIVVKAAQAMNPQRALITGYSIWAVCSALMGGADALISTVAYGESAAIGPRYTHAFIAGKATSGLFLSALRCISKAAMPHDLAGLRASTSIFLSFAAVIVLGCVLVVAFVLPRQRQAIEALKARPGLSVDQTLQVLDHVKRSETLRRLQTLKQPQLQRSNTLKAAVSSGSRQLGFLAQPKYSLFDLINAAMAEAAAQGNVEGLASGKQQGFAGVVIAAAAAAAGSGSLQLRKGDEDEEMGTDCRKTVTFASIKERGSWLPKAEGLAGNSSSNSSSSIADAGVGVVPQLTADNSSSATAAAWRKTAGQALVLQNYKQQQLDADSPAVEEPMWSPFFEQQAPAVTAKPPVRLPRSRQSLKIFAAGGLVREGVSVTSSAWMAVKLIYPYMIAVSLVFFVANFVFPMCLSPQVGKWPEVGTWYTMILVLAYEIGTLLGSTLPIWHPRYPRTSVLSAACFMFVFVPAFILALMFRAGPAAFITLTFVMMAYGSYIAAMVFCLAPHGLLSSDCELVEILLVLVLTLGYIMGLFLSWLWKIPGAFGSPAHSL